MLTSSSWPAQGDRMGAAKLYAERAGTDFVTAQGVVNRL
jgi:hypothetical protein